MLKIPEALAPFALLNTMKAALNYLLTLRRICITFLAFSLVCYSVLVNSAYQTDLASPENALSKTEIHIQEDHVRLLLEIDMADLPLFRRLLPDETFGDSGWKRPPAAERLRAFYTEDFQFRTEMGKPLEATLVIGPKLRQIRSNAFPEYTGPSQKPDSMSDARFQLPAFREVIYFELVYKMPTKPSVLTVIPPLFSDGSAATELGFAAYHQGLLINDINYLLGPEKLKLDWNDPWHTQFANPTLGRYQASALMSFLYIEPYEIRHEILARIKDLAVWLDLDLGNRQFIEVAEWESLKQRVSEFLLSHNPLLVNGKPSHPVLDQSHFIQVDSNGIQVIEQPQRLAVATATMGVTLAYLTEGVPRDVTMQWQLFSANIPIVPVKIVDPIGGVTSHRLTSGSNVLTWESALQNYPLPTVEALIVPEALTHFRVSAGSLLCLVALVPIAWQLDVRRRRRQSVRLPLAAGVIAIAASLALIPYWQIAIAKPSAVVPTIRQEEAITLLQSLLKNIYRAFDFRREEDVYAKLAMSVSGELLSELYLQNRQSLMAEQMGGAQTRIKDVELVDIKVKPLPERPLAFLFKARWTALGSVGHWGHLHTRKNLYDAMVTVEPVDGAWKIVGLELLEEKRLEPSVQSGTIDPATRGRGISGTAED